MPSTHWSIPISRTSPILLNHTNSRHLKLLMSLTAKGSDRRRQLVHQPRRGVLLAWVLMEAGVAKIIGEATLGLAMAMVIMVESTVRIKMLAAILLLREVTEMVWPIRHQSTTANLHGHETPQGTSQGHLRHPEARPPMRIGEDQVMDHGRTEQTGTATGIGIWIGIVDTRAIVE